MASGSRILLNPDSSAIAVGPPSQTGSRSSTPGHSRSSSADLRWTPYNPKPLVRGAKSKDIFRSEPDKPYLSQPCFFGLNCCSVFALTLVVVGMLTIIPPLILTLGPQLRAHETFSQSSCFLLSSLILEIDKPCGVVPTGDGGTTNVTTGARRRRQLQDICPNFVPQFLVLYQPVLLNGTVLNVTTYAYRKITDSDSGGGWKDLQPAKDYQALFVVGQWYPCWYDATNVKRVVMSITLDTIFWTGFGIILAVFLLCIASPVLAWCVVTARRMPYPDRLQLFAQKMLFCCCGKSRSDGSPGDLAHVELADQQRVAELPGASPFCNEKSSIEIPFPSFTSEEEKLHDI